jgi:hypothetical protein
MKKRRTEEPCGKSGGARNRWRCKEEETATELLWGNGGFMEDVPWFNGAGTFEL